MVSFSESNWVEHTLYIVAILVIAFIVFRLLRLFLKRFLHRSSRQLRVDPTNYAFLNNALNLIVITITFIIILYSIPEFRKVGLTLFASAGIFAAIVGFASQAAFSNIISGIFIVIFKPFRVGDIVKVGTDYGGTVEDITLRHTVIKDFENQRYVVPNSILSEAVIKNSSLYDERVANFIFMKISFESDLDKAIAILREEAMNHPNIRDGRKEEDILAGKPKVLIRIVGISDYSVDLRATCWTDDPGSGFELKSDLYRSLKLRFDRENIEIPYPHRTIVEKKNGKVT